MQSTLPQNLSEDITTHPQGSYRRCQGDSTHEHEFSAVWTADCTLASLCKCGQKQECDISQLQESLCQCISLKAQYLQERDKCSSIARSQEFVKAIAVKDRQIAWLERQIEVLSLPNSSLSSTSTCSYLALNEIRRDGGTQPRSAIDFKHVKLLEEQIEDGKELEPVTVFYDAESYWLAPASGTSTRSQPVRGRPVPGWGAGLRPVRADLSGLALSGLGCPSCACPGWARPGWAVPSCAQELASG